MINPKMQELKEALKVRRSKHKKIIKELQKQKDKNDELLIELNEALAGATSRTGFEKRYNQLESAWRDERARVDRYHRLLAAYANGLYVDHFMADSEKDPPVARWTDGEDIFHKVNDEDLDIITKIMFSYRDSDHTLKDLDK